MSGRGRPWHAGHRPVGRPGRRLREDDAARSAPTIRLPRDRRDFAGDPDAYRPKPGVDDRLWDHDAAAVFSNVLRLGPRGSFRWDRLIRHLDPDLWQDIVAARAARKAARDAEPLHAEACDPEADRVGVHVPSADRRE